MRSNRALRTVFGPIAILAALAYPSGGAAQVEDPSSMLIDFDGDGAVTAEELLIRDIWIANDGLLNFLCAPYQNDCRLEASIT